MPTAGPKPKPDAQRRRRNAPTFEWAEVENVPYDGPVPVDPPDEMSKRAQRWWTVVSRMPHCRLWSEADWVFAVESIPVAEAFFREPLKGEKSLRDREKVMGTTLDFRRDIRVRYVEPAEVVPTEVASIDDYRRAAADHFAADDQT